MFFFLSLSVYYFVLCDRPLQHMDADPKHSAREHTGAANKRNTRKKRNRNVSVN